MRPGWARLKVTLPGQIRSNQGINVPGAGLSVASPTEKDLEDLEWTRNHDVAYVGLSFVRSAADVARLRDELLRRGSKARIVAKIEKPQAVANLEAIVAETDAVMIARGDLGVELDVIRVPEIQKRIIETCRRMRVPVITATQMLGSMELSSRPTRAEASDVYNAVLDGTDAVMLSGETAIGAYPVESVSMMSRIVTESERRMVENPRRGEIAPKPIPVGIESSSAAPPSTKTPRGGRVGPVTDSVVTAACQIAEELNAALIAVETHSGRTAAALSNHRGRAPILALRTSSRRSARCRCSGALSPSRCPRCQARLSCARFVERWGRARGLVETGSRIILIRGSNPADPTHNELEVYEVP